MEHMIRYVIIIICLLNTLSGFEYSILQLVFSLLQKIYIFLFYYISIYNLISLGDSSVLAIRYCSKTIAP